MWMENATRSWHNLAGRRVTKRWGIHRISTVIKVLTLWTGPGDIYTLLEESGLVIKKDRLGVKNHDEGRNDMKTGVGMVWKTGVGMVWKMGMGTVWKNGGRNSMKNGCRKCIRTWNAGFFKKEGRIGSFWYTLYPNPWAEKRGKNWTQNCGKFWHKNWDNFRTRQSAPTWPGRLQLEQNLNLKFGKSMIGN